MERYSRIKNTGSYIPEETRTNKDLVSMLGSDVKNGGTSEDWILKRTGMKERRITTEPHETHEYMLKKAIENCCETEDTILEDTILIVAGNTHTLRNTLQSIRIARHIRTQQRKRE
jgi:3-oxoacyl-[acyl-carrier-protein] synthase-3